MFVANIFRNLAIVSLSVGLVAEPALGMRCGNNMDKCIAVDCDVYASPCLVSPVIGQINAGLTVYVPTVCVPMTDNYFTGDERYILPHNSSNPNYDGPEDNWPPCTDGAPTVKWIALLSPVSPPRSSWNHDNLGWVDYSCVKKCKFA